MIIMHTGSIVDQEKKVEYMIPSKRNFSENKITEIQSIYGGFDAQITKYGFKVILKELSIKNMPLFIPKDLTLSDSVELFAKEIVHSKKIYTIYTENIVMLNALNAEISKKRKVDKVLVIDTHNFYHRNFHALPKMYDSEGRPTTLLKAMSNLLKWIAVKDYTHIVFATEGEGSHRIDYTTKILGAEKAYKANRSKTDLELVQQIEMVETFLTEVGYPVLKVKKYEADDIIASVAHKFHNEYGAEVHAFTGDKDLCQLYEYPGFKIIDVKSKEILGEEYLLKKFNVNSQQFLDYQSIVGDTADNIVGVKGIGGAGAVDLLNEFGTLESIINNVEHIKQTARRNAFINGGIESSLLAKDLVYMRRTLLDKTDISQLARKYFDINKLVKEYLSNYQIN